MTTLNLVETAQRIATEAHAGQMRKYTGQPYITHPQRVAARISRLPSGIHDWIAAAWLHDVFEDCDAKWRDEVANECGAEVFAIVHELTNPSKGLGCNRKLRKEIDRAHLERVSRAAVNIKLADRADNLAEMSGAEAGFKRLYFEESKALFDIIGDRGNAELVREYQTALSGLWQQLQPPERK